MGYETNLFLYLLYNVATDIQYNSTLASVIFLKYVTCPHQQLQSICAIECERFCKQRTKTNESAFM